LTIVSCQPIEIGRVASATAKAGGTKGATTQKPTTRTTAFPG
jgi:hypothetical protein